MTAVKRKRPAKRRPVLVFDLIALGKEKRATDNSQIPNVQLPRSMLGAAAGPLGNYTASSFIIC
jgi:hypothetical protein